MIRFKVITFNGNGLGDEIKLNKVIHWCKRFKACIILLQETHVCEARTRWYEKIKGGIWYHSIGESNARGVSTFVNNSLECAVKDYRGL